LGAAEGLAHKRRQTQQEQKDATYLEEEIAAMLQVANSAEEALIRFLLGTGFRIGETAVAERTDVDWEDKTISVRFKLKFGFKPKDYEERSIVVSDTLLAWAVYCPLSNSRTLSCPASTGENPTQIKVDHR